MMARGILGQLRTIRFAGQKDQPRFRRALEQSLNEFAERVLDAADNAG
jgi:hypothetical protein